MGAFIADAGGRPRRYCSDACRQSAGRRRRAGLAENDRPEGRRGRIGLAEKTRAEWRAHYQRLIDELEAAKAELERTDPDPKHDQESVYETRGLIAVDLDEDDRL
jgi:hypothetical protein